MFETLKKTISQLKAVEISSERKLVLQPLIDIIQSKKNQNQTIRLNFICTHNSRRSHLSQIWAQTLAYYFNIPNIYCYSGGTEATALFPKVAETLRNQGFQVYKIAEGINPIYAIQYSINEQSIIGFSKKYNDDFNPQNDFVAIMTCDNADEGCPIVVGAIERIPIKYTDPKQFDNTTMMDEKYIEKSMEIASELYYVMSLIQ